MRLTVAIKTKIIADIAKQALSERYAALEAKAEALGHEIYAAKWQKQHAELKSKLSAKMFKDAFRTGINLEVNIKSPDSKFSNKVYGGGCIAYAKNSSDYMRVFSTITLSVNEKDAPRTGNIAFYSSGGRGELVLYGEDRADKKLYQKAVDFQKELSTFETDAKKLIDQIRSVVLPCTASKKLLELLPEAEAHIPQEQKSVNEVIPASAIQDIQAMLRGAA